MIKTNIIILILLLLLSIKTTAQEVTEINSRENNSKTLIEGRTINGQKEGVWKEYYNPKFKYFSSVVDTLYKAHGKYINGQKQGKWHFYGNPVTINKDYPYDYTNNLDSIVTYDDEKIINTSIFSFPNHLEQKTEINDSTIVSTYYYDLSKENIKINDFPSIKGIITSFKDRNLIIEKYFHINGQPMKEFFTNDNERNELLKVWRNNGSLSIERTTYKKDYDKILYYENGTIYKIEKHINYRLFNVILFNREGEVLETGSFKNGNGKLNFYNFNSNKLTGESEYIDGKYLNK